MLKIAELSRTKEALKEKAVRALNDAGVSRDAEVFHHQDAYG